MMSLIAAAALAAAQPAPATTPDVHAQHAATMAMGDHPAAMKEKCCCEEMMAKMHEGQHPGHEGHPAQ